ncbi:MAG: hypothetical protein HYV40_05425 [Candidatus Levybacteria bacterium]|nr:hypothetical protein [Candidatus Levybacteria bacterium]
MEIHEGTYFSRYSKVRAVAVYALGHAVRAGTENFFHQRSQILEETFRKPHSLNPLTHLGTRIDREAQAIQRVKVKEIFDAAAHAAFGKTFHAMISLAGQRITHISIDAVPASPVTQQELPIENTLEDKLIESHFDD